ncbi:MAG TPA: FAD-binding oxidoreductase [Candidatus Nanopelagicaceae bacterium]|jgi:decaprenylphospho-beta-D-ribofuranose 2-oxidase
MERIESSGWGLTLRSVSNEFEPRSIDELQDFVSKPQAPRGVIAHGLRRSYGDSSLNVGGTTIDTAFLSDLSFHEDSQSVTAGAGVSIRALEVASLARGVFPPVVPGTGFVSIGGAIAADIHGKSHHSTGSFSSCVKRIQLLYSDGEIRDVYPEGPTSEHFWATVGGLGLTGLILEADLQLIPMKTPSVLVEETRVQNLDEMLSLLSVSDKDFQHTVAWIDLSGDFRGRGVVGKGNYVTTESSEVQSPPKIKEGLSLPFPKVGGISFINKYTVRAFNEMWFRKPLTNGVSTIDSFMHPLDKLQNWNRIYGGRGFLQYQFVVPEGNEDFLAHVLQVMKGLGAASFLGVLKRFGKGSRGHLSFPTPGWTLALDIPAQIDNLEQALNSLDSQLCARGGRIYLIKDARLKADFVPLMYPRLEEWRSIRNNMDPNGTWQSDQSRRLKLC